MKTEFIFIKVLPGLVILLLVSFLNFSTNSHTDKKQNFNPDKNHLLGKINPAKDSLFSKVNTRYTSNQKTIYLLMTVKEAYEKMYKAGKESGINLKLISGMRTIYHQNSIWKRK